MTMRTGPWRALAVTSAVLSSAALAGPLDPPAGPIAPTAKPLAEVEPRTAINQANTPGDASAIFNITQPGSYYLTGNVTGVAGRFGIFVNASNVTVDLRGFNLRGVAGSADAIFVNGTGVRIHSGSISEWSGGGINRGGSGSRVHIHDVAFRANASNPSAATVNAFGGLVMERCRVELSPRGVLASGAVIRDCVVGISDPAGYGFFLLGDSVLERCVVNGGTNAFLADGARHTFVDCTANFSGRGFNAGDQTVLERCHVNTAGGDAITVGLASVVTACTVTTSVGGAFRGIVVTGAGGVVRDCAVSLTPGAAFAVADGAVIEGCSAREAGLGFIVGSRCRVTGCTAASNFGAGFVVGASCSLEGCVASFNASHGFSTGDGCTLTGCSATDNQQRGVFANNGCSVLNCLTRNNQGDGIYVNFSCTVAGNTCNGDGAGAGTQGGVRVVGQANRIEGNNITFADRGVMVDASGNVIVRNSARGCAVNFDLVAGNDVGPIGSAAGSTSPWANIQF